MLGLLGALGLVALLLAALGTYGILAYLVSRRTREIGIRMAMGADASSVRSMVLASAARLIAAGLVVGAALAAFGVRFLETILYDTAPLDPLSFGGAALVLVVSGVLLTIGFGLVASRLFGFRYRFAFLSSGAVAICGASAAMAIAAILPRDERSEERLIFTVVGVTLLSTLAMIFYPLLAEFLEFDARTTGIFIGATVHDVAQVVGAGFSVSQETGDVATLVKLLRVLMLAPVVVVAALVIRSLAGAEGSGAERPE